MPKIKKSLEDKLFLFYQFLDEGWSPQYAKGRAGINQFNHIEMKKLSANYENIFKQSYYNATQAKRGWHNR